MGQLSLYNLGSRGVNVDSGPIHKEDGDFTKAQNAVSSPTGADGGLINRPGLDRTNTTAAAGAILGGIGVPLANGKTGTRLLYIGRGRT